MVLADPHFSHQTYSSRLYVNGILIFFCLFICFFDLILFWQRCWNCLQKSLGALQGHTRWNSQQWWSPYFISWSSSVGKFCMLDKVAYIPNASFMLKFRHSSFIYFINSNLCWLYFTFFWYCRNLKLCSLSFRPFIFHLLRSCNIQAQKGPPRQSRPKPPALVWHR